MQSKTNQPPISVEPNDNVLQELLANIGLLVNHSDFQKKDGLKLMKPILENSELSDEDKIKEIAQIAQGRGTKDDLGKSFLSLFSEPEKNDSGPSFFSLFSKSEKSDSSPSFFSLLFRSTEIESYYKILAEMANAPEEAASKLKQQLLTDGIKPVSSAKAFEDSNNVVDEKGERNVRVEFRFNNLNDADNYLVKSGFLPSLKERGVDNCHIVLKFTDDNSNDDVLIKFTCELFLGRYERYWDDSTADNSRNIIFTRIDKGGNYPDNKYSYFTRYADGQDKIRLLDSNGLLTHVTSTIDEMKKNAQALPSSGNQANLSVAKFGQ
jgi:hypothetical protein